MRSLEVTLWIAGAALLALFAGAQAWGEIERQRDIAAFTQARQLAPLQDANRERQATTRAVDVSTVAERPSPLPARDSVLAILQIPGIALEVPVSYGTDERVLLRGAGLVEGTAMPGDKGNVAIAAHRDTHFRGLKDLAVGDQIDLVMPDRTQTYLITDLSVVEPTDVHVLADSGDAILTLVTCYPFYFVGHAPQRFIVRAEAVDSSI